jgi:small GTP-binding protein
MTDTKEGVLHCKVVLAGAPRTGKTSIIHRLINNTFEAELRTTLGVGLSTYSTCFANHQVKLSIWDTAGQEKYFSLANIFFRDAQCVPFVYDITDHESFHRIHHWLEVLQELSPVSHFRVLVASKCDLKEWRMITQEEGRQRAEWIRASYYEVSALSGEGVTGVFDSVVEEFVKFCDGRKIGDKEKMLEKANGGGCCRT